MSGLNHYKYIDALRGFAFLGVLTVHAGQCANLRLGITLTVAGQYGVQLFFLLSAVTLLRSLSLRSREESPLRNFFIRRFFRIAPLFWTGIVFYLFLNGWGPQFAAPRGIAPWHVALTALFLHGWTLTSINSVVPGGWSIAVEMTFYLCLPWLAARITSLRTAGSAFFFALAASIVLDRVLYAALPSLTPLDEQSLVPFFLISWFPSQLPIFLLGFVVYYCLHDPAVTGFLAGPGRPARLLVYAGCGFGAGVCLLNNGPLVPLHVWFALVFAAVIVALAARPYALAVNPVTCGLGVLSFSCYLTHFAALRVVTPLMMNLPLARLPAVLASMGQFALIWTGTLLLTVAASLLTYFAIEKPGMKLGNLLIRAAGPRPPRTGITSP